MDKEIRNLIKRLEHDGVALINNGQLVRNLSKTREISKMRSDNLLFIGKDRRKNITIVLKKDLFDIL